VIAFKVTAMLANGSGGLDWAGLPLACALFGVRDVTGLVERLRVIKAYDAKRADEEEGQ